MKYAVSICLIFFTVAAFAGPSVQVNTDGSYTIQSPVAGWIFRGKVAAPQGIEITKSRGQDRLGAFAEVLFAPKDRSSHIYSIKTYQGLMSVLFSEESNGIPANQLRFPSFERFPHSGVQQLSFQRQEFAPQIAGSSGDAPWLFFAPSGASFILSPADHFMVSNSFLDAGRGLSVGIEPQVLDKPNSFRHSSILTFGAGVNQTYENWGTALLRISGKRIPANDVDDVLNKIGYWSDNRSSYWYNYDLSLGYAGTLSAIRAEFLAQGIPLGHLQLDSWWYLKGGDPTASPPLPISWKQTNYDHGIYLYQAAPELFPDGLKAFQQSVDLPLVTHSRWVDPSSPYKSQYRFSNNVSVDPAYWHEIMKSLKAEGVVVYEQDWLNSKALPRLDSLNDGDAFMDQMSIAASRYGIGLQYCMPLARHFMQGSRYANVRTIRPSGDGFERSRWNQFLYGSRLASAMGIWPWADVFFSADRSNMLIATLSSGIVGVGDRLSQDSDPAKDANPHYCKSSLKCRTLQAQNIKYAIRADGVVVKPDTALVPLDQSYLGMSGLKPDSPPMVSVAYTNSKDGSHQAAYVFMYAQPGGPTLASISPKELGFINDVYVYNFFSGKGERIALEDKFTADAKFNGSYFVIAPIDSDGVAWLGDVSLFVSLGKKRLNVSQAGSRLDIHFAQGESAITLRAYVVNQAHPPKLHVAQGSVEIIAPESAAQTMDWQILRLDTTSEAKEITVDVAR